MILLHGFGQNSKIWAAVQRELDGPPHRAPDLRGHGDASAVRPVDEASLIGDCLELAEQFEDPDLLVGYSMGGRIGLRAVLDRPDLFSGLVLISSGPGIRDPERRRERLVRDEMLADHLEAGDVEAFERNWAAASVWEGQPRAIADLARRMRGQSRPEGLAAALRGFGGGRIEPVWDQLDQLALPVMLICGAEDETYLEIGREMHGLLSDSTIEVVEGAGHSLLLERPLEVAELINRFSRRLPRGGS